MFGTTKYAYDSADRLLAAGTRTFTYDANGNRVSVTDASIHQTRTFTYDAANRLTAATGPKNSSFAYDGDGNRIAQSVGSGTYNYVNDLAAGLPVALQESGPDGNITYAYGLGLIEEAAPAFNYFYQYDGLGSVIGLTDAKGIPQGAYAYDAWGNTLLSVTDVGTRNKFRFTGEALDPGTGLYFLRARYYDPSVGRFSSRDPLAGIVAMPRTANRYAYALSNPLRYRDPSGMTTQDATQGSEFSPLALDFTLPNMINNPQFTSGSGVVCKGVAECVSDALTIVGSVPGLPASASNVASLGSLVVDAYRDTNSANANLPQVLLPLGVDLGLFTLGIVAPEAGAVVGLELFLLNESASAPDTLPATTPSVAAPIGPLPRF